MDFSLKPHPLIAHWIPGFTFLALAWGVIHNWDVSQFAKSPSETALNTLVVIVFAFVVGQVFDAFRNAIVEPILDKWKKIEWLALLTVEHDKVELFDELYFTWYAFDWSLALSLMVLLILELAHLPEDHGCKVGISSATLAVAALFIWDAVSLRAEICEITQRWKEENTQKTAGRSAGR